MHGRHTIFPHRGLVVMFSQCRTVYAWWKLLHCLWLLLDRRCSGGCKGVCDVASNINDRAATIADRRVSEAHCINRVQKFLASWSLTILRLFQWGFHKAFSKMYCASPVQPSSKRLWPGRHVLYEVRPMWRHWWIRCKHFNNSQNILDSISTDRQAILTFSRIPDFLV